MRSALARSALSVLMLCACATPVRVQVHPTERQIRRLALLPFQASRTLVAAGNGSAAQAAPQLVTARVLEALIDAGAFEVVPPAEASRALRAAGLEPDSDPSRIGHALEQAFGVDGYLSGTVSRFRARSGSAEGSTRPAAVRFDLELRGARGEILFRGEYDEAQSSLADDASSFWRALSRRFRWVSAEELARYGAQELVARIQDNRASWR